MARTFLDDLASSPLRPAARDAMIHALDVAGNPGSPHAEGRAAKDLIEAARGRVAAALGTRPREVVFAASGTVASQLGLVGTARQRRETSQRVVISGVEHASITGAIPRLKAEGFDVIVVPPAADGRIDPDRFLDAVGPSAAVAALMLASHDTGACQPVTAVQGALRTRGVPLLCDACPGPGRLDVRRAALDVDLLVLSAHKFGGPRGLGLLVVRRGTRVVSLWSGGLQEERLHPGTENVAAVAGCAPALEEAIEGQPARASRMTACRSALLDVLRGTEGWRLVGPEHEVLPGVVTIELEGVEGEAAMINLDLEGVAVSTGSTCALGGAEPSAGLLALGLTRRRASSTLRFSAGPETTSAQCADAAQRLTRILERLRRIAGR